jgi:hypothetical protein
MLKDNDLAKQFDAAINEKINSTATGLAKIEAFKSRLHETYERELAKLHGLEQKSARKRINLAEMVRGATETELHKIALEIGEQLQKQLNLDRKPKPNEIPRALLGLELGLRFGI